MNSVIDFLKQPTKVLYQLSNWLILVFIVFILTPLFKPDYINNNLEAYIAGLAAILAIYLTIKQNEIANDALFKDLYLHFNSRYNDLNEDIEESKKLNLPYDDLGKEKKHKSTALDYLNLCAEEYFWYQRKRIYEDVWTSWEKGIIENLKRSEIIRNVFTDESNNPDSYYGFFEWYNVKKAMNFL